MKTIEQLKNEIEKVKKEYNLLIAMRIYELECEKYEAVAKPQFKGYSHSERKAYPANVIPDNSELGARERNQSLLN